MAKISVVRTKITPPRPPRRTLERRRVTDQLKEALKYRLTVLQAGTGFGKSTALIQFSEQYSPVIWYQVSKEDSDSYIFLLHLLTATKTALPQLQSLPIGLLEAWDGTKGPLPYIEALDQYINMLNSKVESQTLLIIDDAHLVLQSNEVSMIIDRLIGLSPTNLHIVLAGRPAFRLPNLTRWQAHGEVLSFDQTLLAFTTSEIHQLFNEFYDYDLTYEESEQLSVITEGWPIALQLIWQSIRGGSVTSIESALGRQAKSLNSLFEILAKEVLEQQPLDIQDFLRASATLREMTPSACDAIRQATDSQAMLQYIHRQELFVVDLGEGCFRYQYIFHQFLRQNSTQRQRDLWHQRAAEYYQSMDDPELIIYHLLKGNDFEKAAHFLEDYGEKLILKGLLDTLSSYIEAIPPQILHQHPRLLVYLGDLARLQSCFQEALGWYQQAESLWRERGQWGNVGRALRGQARVYLDTINPARAEELLAEALRLIDGIADRESQARLYELLAENKLNAGKPNEAEELRKQAEKLRLEGPTDSQLVFRVLLRTGRLEEARRKLEDQIQQEVLAPIQIPRAHRETLFLISIVYAFQGEAEKAFETAFRGTQRGIELDSPFMRAVGHMRQGHAFMLLAGDDRYEKARSQFEEAIEISHALQIPRLRVEAYWGMCRTYGYQGDLGMALQTAQEGIDIATQAGDEWISSLVRVAYGASLVLSGRYESSLEWLTQAARSFHECSDPFGYTAARLWLCYGWFRQHDYQKLAQVLPEVLALSKRYNYDYLLTRPTLLGPPTERLLVPMLIYARNNMWEGAYVERLLHMIGLPNIYLHPGYQLRVSTFGKFEVLRGEHPIPQNGWQREKTKQLFQLLITYHNAPLDREQIFEYLWPLAEPEVANRNFKVVLNTLFKVLEPERIAGDESAYIIREGGIYGIRPGTDIWLDTNEFLKLVQQGDVEFSINPSRALSIYEKAIDLYKGEYLPDARYENWAAGERERLAVKFLLAADRLCELYLDIKRIDDVIALCQRILSQDNCWERAYRHMMVVYHRLGDHGRIARTYQRCTRNLRDELDVLVSPETQSLFDKLMSATFTE